MSQATNEQIGGAHYKDLPIQPTEFIHRNGIPFIEGNVIKYVCRHRHKNGRQDIEKAIHYLRLLLEFEYETENKENYWARDIHNYFTIICRALLSCRH